MTKEEARSSVMSSISMALKNSTLQQGFEIICKNLLELEKKNTDLELKIKKLKEENTKLKERNAELAGQKASLERWFGEAKEIIIKYYNYNPSCEYSYDDIDKQAELFLKGCKESG